MNIISPISIPFYEFTADEELTNDVLEDVKNLNFDMSNEGNNMSYANGFYYHPKLFDFFDKCLSELKTTLKFKEKLDLTIVSCWANKNSKLEYHHYHPHPNSIVSAIFYLTTHESGNTVFVIPDPWYKNINSFMECSTKTGQSYGEDLPQISGKNKPVSGKLVLFPSHVKHKVLPLTSNENRYTISFNTFLSGVLGEDNRSVYLNLKSKSVKEMIEEKTRDKN